MIHFSILKKERGEGLIVLPALILGRDLWKDSFPADYWFNEVIEVRGGRELTNTHLPVRFKNG